MQTIVVPVTVCSVSKPTTGLLFENGIGQWKKQASTAAQAWSNVEAVANVCEAHGAEMIVNHESMICTLKATTAKTDLFRADLQNLSSPTKVTLPCDSSVIAPIGSRINFELAKQLTKLGEAYGCYISASRSDNGGGHSLTIIGLSENVEYTKFKCQALLEFYNGCAVQSMEIPLSIQHLVFGPCKMHLHNIFQQTTVNVYAPPFMAAGRVAGASWDQIYLVGEPVQVAVAKTMVQEIVDKTEILMKTCLLPLGTLDLFYHEFQSEIYELTAVHATFIQWPTSSSTVRVLGTNRKSIQSTITGLMKLCTKIYSMIATCSSTPRRATLLNLAKTGLVIQATDSELVVVGPASQIHQATKSLTQTQGIGSIAYALELDNQLKDFLAGKKNGKILKVMNSSNSKIWFEPLHEYNLRVMMLCPTAQIATNALPMLEDEMPAEEEIFIAEPYHKQIIGAGGQRIQSLMRRYNVYIKFEAVSEKVPNAFANLQLNNVLVRCPKKHSKNIAPAIQDLHRNVVQCEKEHSTTYLKLSRNHRRLLIGSHGNLVRDIEKWSNAVIKYPKNESRHTELLEITGLGQASISAAQTLHQHLPYDYEFRVAFNKAFPAAVGPQSTFALRVTAPLRAAFNAQVQAFERVQVEGDNTVYSQIMVSIPEEDDFIINEIDMVVTNYLRDYSLDIIEKGPLSMNLIVDGTAAMNSNKPKSKNAEGSENSVTPLKQQPVTFNFTRTPMTPTPRVANQMNGAMAAPPSLNWRHMNN